MGWRRSESDLLVSSASGSGFSGAVRGAGLDQQEKSKTSLDTLTVPQISPPFAHHAIARLEWEQKTNGRERWRNKELKAAIEDGRSPWQLAFSREVDVDENGLIGRLVKSFDLNGPNCAVCRNLSRFQYVEQYEGHTAPVRLEPIVGALGQFQQARKRGCPICSLVVIGISNFAESLTRVNHSWFRPVENNVIRVWYSRQQSLCVAVSEPMTPNEFSIQFHTHGESTTTNPLAASRSLPGHLDLDYTVETVRKWASECSSSHVDCQVPLCPPLPTRVLDLGPSDTRSEVKLLITSGAKFPYIALSYCWGNAENMIKTTKSSITEYIKEIPWGSLPKTFQDAIHLTRALKIRYIWIDSLCIQQDDLQDWERESTNMAAVYSNSYLTIAATAGSNPHAGLFVERWTQTSHSLQVPRLYQPFDDGDKSPVKFSIQSVKLPIKDRQTAIYIRPQLHLAHDRFQDLDNAGQHIEDAPLLSRAWTFQERLLPARTLHFHAEELLWECRAGVSCECNRLRINNSSTLPSQDQQKSGWMKENLAIASRDRTDLSALGFVWLDTVTEYSRLRLTKESDRVAAIAGLASSLKGTVLGEYLAGIWKGDIERGLLFERIKIPKMEHKSAQSQAAISAEATTLLSLHSPPSWSWFSISFGENSAISYDSVIRSIRRNGFLRDANFRIISASTSTVRTSSIERLTGGRLQIRGAVIPAKLQGVDDILEISLPLAVHRMPFVSDECTALRAGETLFCLVVGSSKQKTVDGKILTYALVLRKSEDGIEEYRRVGLLKGDSGDWLFMSRMQTLIMI